MLHAMTMVDPVTCWFEITKIPAKTANVVISTFENDWLTCYPCPVEIVMDRGMEFMGEVQ